MSVACDRIVTGGILFLILFTPISFGAVHPWAYTTMEVVVFGMVILWMLKVAILARKHGAWSNEQGGDRLTPHASRLTPLTPYASRLTPLALPLALFFALVLFQLVPLPPSLLRVFSPQTYELYTQVLPGWPLRAPYADLGQMSEVRDQSASPLTPDPSRSASPEVGSQTSEIDNQKSEADNSEIRNSNFEIARRLPAPRSLLPETWLPLSVVPALTRTDFLKFSAYGALLFLILLYPFSEPELFPGIRYPRSAISYPPLDPRPSTLEARHSTLDPRHSTLDTRHPTLDTRPSTLDTRFFRLVLMAVLFAGLLVATIGFAQRFSWSGKILWFFVPYDWGVPRPDVPRASGPFVNPNHFANYLSLVLPIAIACTLFRTFIVSKPLEKAFRICCGLTAFLLFTGIVLSLSRSGWIGALLGVVILAWLSPRAVGHASRLTPNPSPSNRASRLTPHGIGAVARLSLITLCVLLIVSLFIIGPGGREQVDARLGQTIGQDAGFLGRMAISKDSLLMIRDFPLMGVGLGGWPELFPHYRRAPWSGDFYREAHNEYVQLLAETGVVGFGLLTWFFLRGGRRLLSGHKKASTEARPVIAALIAALGVMAFHECFDFNLHIPANAFLFTLLFALAVRVAGSREQGAGSKEHEARSGKDDSFRNSKFAIRNPLFQYSRVPAFRPVAVALAALGLAACALAQEQTPYPYNLKEPASLAEAQELVLAHPTHAPYHLSLLRIMGNKAPPALQVSESRAALWIEPTNPYYRDFYAGTLMSMGRTEEGLREVTRSVADSPSLNTHVYLSAESLALLSGEEQGAVEVGFRQALARSYPEALNGLAEFYAKLNRFADQGALYEEAALKESESEKKADLLVNAGLAYLRAGEQGARSANQRSELRSQRSADARDASNATNAELNDSDSKNSKSAIRNPKFEDAERLFRAAIAINPTDPRPYQQLATVIYGARKDLAAAKEIVAQGIRNGAPPVPLYLALAEVAQKAESPDDIKAALKLAKTEVEKTAKSGDDPYPLYIELAGSARQAGHREEELAALLALLELRPRSPDILSRLANVYIEQRNFDRAAFYLNRIASINPNSADVYYQLAVAEEGRYRFADAAKAYARAVELAPQNAGYRQRYEAFKTRVDQNRSTNSMEQGARSTERRATSHWARSGE